MRRLLLSAALLMVLHGKRGVDLAILAYDRAVVGQHRHHSRVWSFDHRRWPFLACPLPTNAPAQPRRALLPA